MTTTRAEEDFAEAMESNQGWCTHCQEFTHEFAEPDAEGHECPACGRMTVMGAEQALICGEIEFE
jgi:rRNA maturation endonuclease Nob1